MFAYCRNGPVFRVDTTGTEDTVCLESEDGSVEVIPAEVAVVGAGSIGSSSFRQGVLNISGASGKGMDAHHIFPQKFSEFFRLIGINNQNPLFGSLVESSWHRQFSHEYNLWWEAFFSIDGVTSDDAFSLVELLAELFGFELLF